MIDANSQFFAILTNVGMAKQANADALGIPWKITDMGVGDANGTDPIPSVTQTHLINEWRRRPLNQLKTDPVNPAVIIAEQIIPADEGGKWIREIGLYDVDGDLVAVANCAPSFKPVLSQGSGRTQVVRMNFIVSSTGNITLKIDPSVVLATREYVDQKVLAELSKQDFKHSVLVATTGPMVLSGLRTVDDVPLSVDARVLVKNQAAPKDNGLYSVAVGAWTRSADADSSLEVTPGLFVHVERGTASGDSIWQLVTDTPTVLGTTDLVFEMAAGRTGINAGTYRSVTVDKYGRVVGGTNPTTLAGMGITDSYTKAEIEAMIAQASALPVGATVAFPNGAAPPGFLEIDGSVRSIATYPDLAAYLGTTFNKGNEGAGNFRLPDSRGEFLRGWDHGRGVDAGRALGSFQLGTVAAFDSPPSLASVDSVRATAAQAQADPFNPGDYPGVSLSWCSTSISSQAQLSEGGITRPRNMAVMWCIKAWNALINQGAIDVAALASDVQKLFINGPVVGTARNAKMYVTAVSANAAFTAEELIVSNALGGRAYKLANFNKTINLATVGAGGMDTGAAPVNGYVALYAIFNPVSGLSSILAANYSIGPAAAPAVYGGANMPAGYTHSALISVWGTNASGQLKVGLQRDRRVSIPPVTVLNTVTQSGGVVPLNIISCVPPSATSCRGNGLLASTAPSSLTMLLFSDALACGQQYVAANQSTGVVGDFELDIYTLSQIYYNCLSSAGTPQFSIVISSYTF
jgi:phage-related tail fiber protein